LPRWKEVKGISVSNTHFRSGIDLWTVEKGPGEIGGDGLIARYKKGKGKVIFFQITPEKLNYKEKTYFRFTSWRIAEAISIVITNLGGEFSQNRKWGEIGINTGILNISGEWKYKIESKGIAKDKPLRDNGNKGELLGWANPEFNDNDWKIINLPQYWENAGIEELKDLDGAVWFRKKIVIPESWQGKDLILNLGAIDDFDTTYFNGVKIGGIGKETPNFWLVNREYVVPAKLINSGENIIAIRVFDHFGSGGFAGTSEDIVLKMKNNTACEFYFNDYRTDFARGDDSYRFWRW